MGDDPYPLKPNGDLRDKQEETLARKSRWAVDISDDPGSFAHDYQPTIREAIEEYLSCGALDDERCKWPLELSVFEVHDITAPNQSQAWDWFEEYFYDDTYEGFELPGGMEAAFKAKWAELESTVNSLLKSRNEHMWHYCCEVRVDLTDEEIAEYGLKGGSETVAEEPPAAEPCTPLTRPLGTLSPVGEKDEEGGGR